MLGQQRNAQYFYCYTCKSSSLLEEQYNNCPLCNSDFIEECKMPEYSQEISENHDFSNEYLDSSGSSDSENMHHEYLMPVRINPFPSFNFIRENSPSDLFESLFRFRFGPEHEELDPPPFIGLRQLRELGNQHRRHQPAPAQSIALIETKVIVDNQETECKICADMFKVEEKAKSLYCGHLFHEICLIPWLKMKNSCPVCRKTID